MVVSEEQKCSPLNQKKTFMESNSQNNVANLISPRLKSAAAMAGWDEEALLLASLIVEDTPDREPKHKKRFVLNSKSPPTNSSRKRRARRTSQSIPVAVLNLDEEETPQKESAKKKKEKKICVSEGSSKMEENELTQKSSSGVSSTTTTALPCIDKLREELSCAICLEICLEPSTTPCGHSFCRKCLRSAADKCGRKCPKCRQLISNGRSCTVNTVLWNTIQLLFPQEVEARKAAATAVSNNRQGAASAVKCLSPEAFYSNVSNRSIQPIMARRRGVTEYEVVQNNHRTTITRSQTSSSSPTTSGRVRTRRGGGATSQNADAALALRLQREEFMQAFRSNGGSQVLQDHQPSSSLARANLRAMASRAMNLRIRDRRM